MKGTQLMRLTLEDIAKKAKVAKSTVSRALNKPELVSDNTRRHIIQVMRDLGYEPNNINQLSRRTGNLAFLIDGKGFSPQELFYTKIFKGAEAQAKKDGYHFMLTITSSEEEATGFLDQGKVDGVIVAAQTTKAFFRRVVELEYPAVFVDCNIVDKRMNRVEIDNFDGAFEAVNYLIGLGHRHIGFVGANMRHPSILHRFYGYREALLNSGIEPDPDIIVADRELEATVETGMLLMKRMLERTKNMPTAIFGANDHLAVGAIKAVRSSGMSVPDDISVIGFDDVDIAIHSEPPLTTMRIHKEEIGALAVVRLEELMSGRNVHPSRTVVCVNLVERESCVRCKNR
ncbi:MAG: LacI family DNA-binding transcriptional regulator [Firmicutes bacterium]|nr:LacI family DNA-binding transcriptional regulator [Bacillota bacterium]